jgi:hypothetical protein
MAYCSPRCTAESEGSSIIELRAEIASKVMAYVAEYEQF